MLMREPSFAELSKTISVAVAVERPNGTRELEGPARARPDVAVTKFSAMTAPSVSVSSYWKFASNVFAVPVARSGLVTSSNESGRLDEDRGSLVLEVGARVR